MLNAVSCFSASRLAFSSSAYCSRSWYHSARFANAASSVLNRAVLLWPGRVRSSSRHAWRETSKEIFLWPEFDCRFCMLIIKRCAAVCLHMPNILISRLARNGLRDTAVTAANLRQGDLLAEGLEAIRVGVIAVGVVVGRGGRLEEVRAITGGTTCRRVKI